MKRDMDLIRRILLAVEAKESDCETWVEQLLPDVPVQTAREHARLLLENEKYVSGNVVCAPDGVHVSVRRLTMEGHDLLDLMRPEPVWQRFLQKAGQFGGEIALDTAKAMLQQIAMEQLGL